MTYEEIVAAARETVQRIDTTQIREHAAIEIDISGEGEGAFYVEFTDGAVHVEPYEYYGFDCRIRTNAATFTLLLSGMLDPYSALYDGSINLEGNIEKAIILATALRALNGNA